MTNDKKQRLGINHWDAEKVEMFENIISHIETYEVLMDVFKNSPFLNNIKGAYFVTPHESMDIIERITSKTFEEIQTIMEGEGT